jgi:DNA-directed RNA polymerase specialized sigma24 family protein
VRSREDLPDVEQLSNAAREADSAAREAFCRSAFRIAYQVAKRFGFDAMDAEDVAQEMVVRSLERLSVAAINSSWIHSGATFLCIDIMRRRRTASGYMAVPKGSADWPIPHADLVLMLERLSPSCRRLIVLHFVEGWSFAEIDTLRGDGRRRSQFDAKRCFDHLIGLARRAPG